MIACFPEIYPDELLYSQLARYYAQSGYMAYRYAAEDLYINRTVRPDMEFLNKFSDDAFLKITQLMPIEIIVEKHTMFPYYGRFLPVERRNNAFQSLVNMRGNHRNLLVIPKRKTDKNRYIRYCPLCAANDRKLHGETYWHREHQMQGVDICNIHGCYLEESDLIISGKASPMLVTAEECIPNSNETIMCENELERKFVGYVTEVFNSDINMKSDVFIGDFLHSRMGGTKYRSVRGQQRNIALFHADFTEYYKSFSKNWFTELWQIQKVLANDRINTFEICLLAMFLNVSADELTNMTLPKKRLEDIFDEQIHLLHSKGLKYPKIAQRLNASYSVVKSIGEDLYGTYHKTKRECKQPKKSTDSKNWNDMDNKTLPLVKNVIKELQGDRCVRPKKITIFAVGKRLGLTNKQFKNLSKCRNEIEKHYESQEQYWAREVVWAANYIIDREMPFNWKHIRELINIKKINLRECMPYLHNFTDEILVERIEKLL